MKKIALILLLSLNAPIFSGESEENKGEQDFSQPSKIYFQGTYPPDHWALRYRAQEDNDFIARLKVYGEQLEAYVNPTDARGYRTIVRLINPEDMQQTLNRDYTSSEITAVTIGLGLLKSAIERKLPLIVQIEVAGNNSQALDEQGKLVVGNDREPSMLHGHLICRGNPDQSHIDGVTLSGPRAGELFDMRGKGSIPGNEKKEKWTPESMISVACALAQALREEHQQLQPPLRDLIQIELLRE